MDEECDSSPFSAFAQDWQSSHNVQSVKHTRARSRHFGGAPDVYEGHFEGSDGTTGKGHGADARETLDEL